MSVETSNTARSAGCFVAVVGPSGAGKDTLLDAARLALGQDERFHFARRVITRAQMAGTEDHDTLDQAGFARAVDEGRFALHWQAHELRYGIPRDVNALIARGTTVIANVSRQALDDIRALYQPYSIVLINAAPDILATRLAARGRESREQIIARLARQVSLDAENDDIVTIDNSGDVKLSTTAFIDHLVNLSTKTKD